MDNEVLSLVTGRLDGERAFIGPGKRPHEVKKSEDILGRIKLGGRMVGRGQR